MHIFCSLLSGEIGEGINEMKLEYVAGGGDELDVSC